MRVAYTTFLFLFLYINKKKTGTKYWKQNKKAEDEKRVVNQRCNCQDPNVSGKCVKTGFYRL